MAEPTEVKENNKVPVLLAVALLVIGVSFALFLRNRTSVPTEESPKESDSAQVVSEENASTLRNIFGDDFVVDFYASRSTVDIQVEGVIQDDSLKITHVYWQPFSVASEIRAIEERMAFSIPPGDYSMFLVETAAPLNNPAISYQLGASFTPEGYPIAPLDPMSLEPIMRYPSSLAFFEVPLSPDYPWQEIAPFDVANSFVPLEGGAMGWGYINPDSNISVMVLPQEYVGLSGSPTNLTIQMFGRDVANPENFGVSGVTCSLDSVPGLLDSLIFADGFESGDTSAWSNSYCN